MKIAIHPEPAHGFGPRFIDYCERQRIPWKAVDCYRSDIMGQIADCQALLWHWYHSDPRAALMARALLHAAEVAGKVVFPSVATGWHFDDKIAQKYLLEGLGFPLPRVDVFYERAAALQFVAEARYPLVAKLRGGAGSLNVRKLSSAAEARRYVDQAFGRGFPPLDREEILRERWRVMRRDRSLKAASGLVAGLARRVVPTELERLRGNDKGYVYFQAMVPNNDHDTRVVAIGQRAIAFRRGVRPGDFRASGSGDVHYEAEAIDPRCVRMAFAVLEATGAQCLACDFVFEAGEPRLLEISYGFTAPLYDRCPGYWDRDLTWHPGRYRAQDFIMEDVVEAVRARSR